MSAEVYPIIFLDIDGVLNSGRSYEVYCERDITDIPKKYNWAAALAASTVDPVAVALVNRVIAATKAKVVVSSSHRVSFIKGFGYTGVTVVDLVELREYIHALGIEAEVIDATPLLPGYARGEEIKQWLRLHPSVTDYLILDDDADMLEEQQDRFVHTSTSDGFMFSHYRKALKILNGGVPHTDVTQMCRTNTSY